VEVTSFEWLEKLFFDIKNVIDMLDIEKRHTVSTKNRIFWRIFILANIFLNPIIIYLFP
jgi:hypothetical protein